MRTESGARAVVVHAELLPVAVGRGCVATEVPSSHGDCGGGEDACGKSRSVLVPFVHASVGWSFWTVTLQKLMRGNN